MKVSLRMAFTMTSFSNVKPLYEGFAVTINGREWTVNIMMLGETGLALIAGRLIPLSQVGQYLGLEGRSRNGAELDFFGKC